MNQMQSYPQNQQLIIESHENVQVDTANLIINPQAFFQLSQFANMMAGGKSTIPQHLQGNPSDCMAVCMQAMQWRMNPFAVAQKTHLVNGQLGYEAQLVNAVITSLAPITGRLQFEWFGEWERIIGRFKEIESKDKFGNLSKKIVKDWTLKDEEGLGVKVWATLKGEEEPRVLELLLSQAGVRNSPLWGQDPKQQLAYLAIKRWSRLYCPDVILGVYTPDELDERPTTPKDVTPPPAKNAGSSFIKERLKAKRAEVVEVVETDVYDISLILEQIKNITTMEQIQGVGQEIKALSQDPDINLLDEDRDRLRGALAFQRGEVIFNNLLEKIRQTTLENAEEMRQELYDNRDKLGEERFAIIDSNLDEHLNQFIN